MLARRALERRCERAPRGCRVGSRERLNGVSPRRRSGVMAFSLDVAPGLPRPSLPTDNASVGSFIGKFRVGRLNSKWFLSLDQARKKHSRLGEETVTTVVRIARSAAKRGNSVIRAQATLAGRAPMKPDFPGQRGPTASTRSGAFPACPIQPLRQVQPTGAPTGCRKRKIGPVFDSRLSVF